MSEESQANEEVLAAEENEAVEVTSSECEFPAIEFPIVGIGASAGGLEAIERFFDNTPTDTGMAFIIVQHLSPDFKSLMDELLARHTKMPIHKVENGMAIQPNGIYLIPPKKNMVLSDSKLLLTDQDASGGLNMPIDILFRSMARDAGGRCIAVVLSGTGSDGSRGLQAIHDAGGLVVVQEVDSAGFDGMPRNAIATGVVDVITKPEKIASRIVEYVRSPGDFVPDERAAEEIEQEDEMASLFRLFRSRFGLDFRAYKPTTINRRLERRLTMGKCDTLRAYVDLLESDVDELEALYRDLLVEVTHFFRDAEAFGILQREIVPQIIANAEEGGQIRVWAPGCATGEEAYSLAMLFHEHLGPNPRSLNVKVFATDVHTRSLETASLGSYSAESVSRLTPERKDRYFSQHGSIFHVSQELRKMVIFAPHDITKDPPFTKLDLLVCRNVLIYLEQAIQQRIVAMYHFGLKVGGYLMLGPSETVRPFEREFDTVNQQWKVYKKLRDIRLRDTAGMSMLPPLHMPVRAQISPLASPSSSTEWTVPKAFESLLAKYVPPSLLVNEHFELEHTFGEARKYLSQPTGRPTLEILKLMDGDLRMALSAALHRAARQNSTVVYRGVKTQVGEEEQLVKLTIEPYSPGNKKFFLIGIEDLETPKRSAKDEETYEQDFDPHGESAERITDLERELNFTKESLQSTVEELETSNEELQATNEELVASNEELQSTNEELHSVNEELYTVNAEHQRKISELTEVTSDMDNLLQGTQIGTIFLDRELKIRKFTPSIASAFHVLEQDVGRPIEHIAYNLDNPELMQDIETVINGTEIVERKVRSKNGRPFFQRITPYALPDGEIGGVILTFTDVTAIEEASREAERRAEELERSNLELVEFAYAVSHDLRSPLRHINDHGRILVEEAEAQLNEQAKRSLNVITNGASQLSSMIDALLAYSRVHTRGEPPEVVDCGELLEVVKEKLKDQIDCESATITHDALPKVMADRGQLQTVFTHLIDNAIRYRRDEDPKIHIEARKHEETWQFSFEDNGMGIEPRSFERIFVIFQRLYRDEQIPGEGVGLALCKRVVERHGGRIWLTSRPGRGSTFYFSLADEKLGQRIQSVPSLPSRRTPR